MKGVRLDMNSCHLNVRDFVTVTAENCYSVWKLFSYGGSPPILPPRHEIKAILHYSILKLGKPSTPRFAKISCMQIAWGRKLRKFPVAVFSCSTVFLSISYLPHLLKISLNKYIPLPKRLFSDMETLTLSSNFSSHTLRIVSYRRSHPVGILHNQGYLEQICMHCTTCVDSHPDRSVYGLHCLWNKKNPFVFH